MVSVIFTEVTAIITAFTGAIGDAIEAVAGMFYDGTSLTLLGTLSLIAVGVGIVYWAFGLIRGLVSRRA